MGLDVLASEASAEKLATHLTECERLQQQFHSQVAKLVTAREDALLEDDDAAVDQVERDTAVAMRGLDRCEALIPRLRALHAERLAQEAAETNCAAFEEAVAQRIDAAKAVDAALAEVGLATDALHAAGKQLQRLSPFHRVTGIDQDDPARRALVAATLQFAQSYARAAGLNPGFGNKPECLTEVEERRWARVRRHLKQEADPCR